MTDYSKRRWFPEFNFSGGTEPDFGIVVRLHDRIATYGFASEKSERERKELAEILYFCENHTIPRMYGTFLSPDADECREDAGMSLHDTEIFLENADGKDIHDILRWLDNVAADMVDALIN